MNSMTDSQSHFFLPLYGYTKKNATTAIFVFQRRFFMRRFQVLSFVMTGLLIMGVMVACGDSESTPSDTTCSVSGDVRCNGDQVEVCSSGLTWTFLKDCASQYLVCQQGVCVPDGTDGDSSGNCTPGEKTCTNNTKVSICGTSGEWEDLLDCADYQQICQSGECMGCAAGAVRCNPAAPAEVEKCDRNGEWIFYRDCSSDDKTCDLGACVGGTVDGDEADGDVVEQDPELVGDVCNDSTPCTDSSMYCFKEEEQTDGICIKYCDLENNCPSGYTCDTATFTCIGISGYCVSGGQCMAGREFCDMISGQDYGLCKPYCYLPGEACPVGTKCCLQDSIDSDCAGRDGKCISTQGQCSSCYSDFDCGSMAYCEKITGQNIGCCKPKCSNDDDCPAGLVCRTDGRCGSGNSSGDCGGPCPTGYECDPLYNQCVLNCPACGPMECCDAISAPNCYTCECINPTICGILLEQCCFGYSCSAIVYGVLGYCI